MFFNKPKVNTFAEEIKERTSDAQTKQENLKTYNFNNALRILTSDSFFNLVMKVTKDDIKQEADTL